MLRRSFVLATLVAGCAPSAPPPTLPDATAGGAVTTDPITQARQRAGEFFRAPQANQPAKAARAIADIEYLAGAVPADPRWSTANPVALTRLTQARREGREALGIPASANAQAVIDGLLAAATALDAGATGSLAMALPRSVFTAGPQETVRRLSRPPRMPDASPALFALAVPSQGR